MKPEIDFRSETWRALKDRAEARLESLRKKNEGPLSQDATATVRGQIIETREFLALEKAPEQLADEQ